MVFLIVGFLLNFFGIKLFRFVLAVTSFILFSLLGYIILINVHLHEYNFGDKFDWIVGAGVLGFGTFGFVVSAWLWKWVLIGLGALGGISLGLILLASLAPVLKSTSASTSSWMNPILLGIFAIVGGVLVKKYERSIIILATSTVGSFLFCFGLDCFIRTGFDLIILNIIAGSPIKYKNTSEDLLNSFNSHRPIYGIISLCLGLAILGLIVQSKLVGRNIKSHLKH